MSIPHNHIYCSATLQSVEGAEFFRVITREEPNDGANIYDDCNMAIAIIDAIRQKASSLVCNGVQYKVLKTKVYRGIHNPYFLRQVNLANPNNHIVVYVYKRSAACPVCQYHHRPQQIEQVVASMYTCSGQLATEINLQYCLYCKRYSIEQHSLKLYEQKYGTLCIERNMSYVNTSWYYNEYDFNPDSVLSRNGYTANGTMNAFERQRCLTYIIESGKASKYAIINHLSHLIDFNGTNCSDAYYRWLEDLRFVNDYDIQSQRYVGEIRKLIHR